MPCTLRSRLLWAGFGLLQSGDRWDRRQPLPGAPDDLARMLWLLTDAP